MAQSKEAYYDKLVYIDGCAGPGQHENGDEGSPVSVYRALMTHSLLSNFKPSVDLVFIEADVTHAKNLEKLLSELELKYRNERNRIGKSKQFAESSIYLLP